MFAGGRGRLGRQTVNRIRFSFYDRYENSAFDARPYSITGNEVPKPSHYDERFGGNLGGPLKIPHIYNGSDKTYFFANYQHETQSSALDTYSTVPTAAERTGNFCGLGITLYDPFSNFSGPAHSARQRLPGSHDQFRGGGPARVLSAAESARHSAKLSSANHSAGE